MGGRSGFHHAQVKPHYHKGLAGLIMQFAADALALFFLYSQQVPGKFGNPLFAFPESVDHAGPLDGERCPVPNGAQKFALGRQPFIGFAEANYQYPDGFALHLQRNAPKRLGLVADQGRKHAGLGTGIEHHRRLAGGGDLS